MPSFPTGSLTHAWAVLLTAGLLILVRISGMMVFVPPFASQAIPTRIKIALTLALTIVTIPAAASARAPLQLDLEGILGELSVGLLLGICLSLLQEALGFAGYLLNLEFSFSLVNVLDPGSSIETPLMGQMTQLIFLLVVFAGGLDRVVIEALLRTMVVVPPGHARFDAMVAPGVVSMFGGVLLAGVQLASPVVAATFLVQLTAALIGKLSPSLPVLIVGIPLKTLAGYVVLMASLSLWPRFIDSRFSALLDAAMHLLVNHARS